MNQTPSPPWRPEGPGAEDTAPWVPVLEPLAASGRSAARIGKLRYNWFGADPALRRDRLPFRPNHVGAWLGGVLVGALGLLFAASIALGAWTYVHGAPEGGAALSGDAFATAAAANFVIFVFPPLVWVAGMYSGGASAWRVRLLFTSHHLPKEVGIGLLLALGQVLLVALVIGLLAAADVNTDNPAVEELAGSLDWVHVPIIALAAGIGEEILFRGFLQPRIGIVPTAVLFGVAHLSYGVPLQVIVPLALGVLYSLATIRYRSLIPAMVGHTAYDAIALSVGKLAVDNGWA